MTARKSAAKHDRCIDHVAHPYPKGGKLCIGETIGRSGMLAFADEIAATAAAHRAAFAAEPVTLPADGSHARAIAEHRTINGVDYLCRGERDARGIAHCSGSRATVHLHTDGGKAQDVRNDVGLADIVARYREMRGIQDAPTLPTPQPIRRTARKVPPTIADAIAAAAAGGMTPEAIAQLCYDAITALGQTASVAA